jgi:hypothetical protein
MSELEIDLSKINEKIKLDRVGKILTGRDQGGYVKVHFDSKVGFYIFQSNSPKFNTPETYDGWAEDEESLNLFFEQCNWTIDWFPDLRLVP